MSGDYYDRITWADIQRWETEYDDDEDFEGPCDSCGTEAPLSPYHDGLLCLTCESEERAMRRAEFEQEMLDSGMYYDE